MVHVAHPEAFDTRKLSARELEPEAAPFNLRAFVATSAPDRTPASAVALPVAQHVESGGYVVTALYPGLLGRTRQTPGCAALPGRAAEPLRALLGFEARL